MATPRAAAERDGPPLSDDLVTRSVELGYRVVDEYLKRGQQAAQRVRHGAYGAEEMAQDAQSVASQLVRTASDFAGAWVEFFALAGRDAAATTQPASPLGATPSPSASRGSATAAPHADAGASATESVDHQAAGDAVSSLRVRLVVTAARPVETALDVVPIPASHTLVVGRLCLERDDATRILDVRVVHGDDDLARIHVNVQADQAPGHYSAVVLDDTTNVPIGELTVVVPAVV